MANYSEYLIGKRALSNKQIMDINFPYLAYENDIEEGEYIVTLDMKEWGKSLFLRCFFTTEDDRKIALIVYVKNDKYAPGISVINFSDVNIQAGEKFVIKVNKTENGKLKWIDAERIF